MTYFLIKLSGRYRRRPTWLYLSDAAVDGPYKVTSLRCGTRGSAKLMGKLEAEKLAASIRAWKNAPASVVVEPAKEGE